MTFEFSLDAFVAELELGEYRHVMALCTARSHGRGPQRLPDRGDHGRKIAAVQVETADEARSLFQCIDDSQRTIYVDVERKQDLDLLGLAQQELQKATVRGIKPNDITVKALDLTVTHLYGEDVTNATVGILGTGNLAFKFAMLLAERGAQVYMHGRNHTKATLLCEAINSILPAYTPHKITPKAGINLAILVSANTGVHVVDASWAERLSSNAICVDVGINNFSPEFISSANRRGHTCVRLDFRSAGDALPNDTDYFFSRVAGHALLNEIPIVAGGYIGRSDDVVVDQVENPTRIIGVANGTGGLLDPKLWNTNNRDVVDAVRHHIDERKKLGG